MRDAFQKIGEFRGAEVGFQMHFNPGILGNRERTFEDTNDDVLFFPCLDGGCIDEWEDDARRANLLAPTKHAMENPLPFPTVLFSATDEREIHQPVSADRRRSNFIPRLERVLSAMPSEEEMGFAVAPYSS